MEKMTKWKKELQAALDMVAARLESGPSSAMEWRTVARTLEAAARRARMLAEARESGPCVQLKNGTRTKGFVEFEVWVDGRRDGWVSADESMEGGIGGSGDWLDSHAAEVEYLFYETKLAKYAGLRSSKEIESSACAKKPYCVLQVGHEGSCSTTFIPVEIERALASGEET